jgi:hypothetical protein
MQQQETNYEKLKKAANEQARAINEQAKVIVEHTKVLEVSQLRDNQVNQTLEQYRMDLYQSGLKFDLLLKILMEKGIFVKDEFDKRWPLYLKNDVGVMDPNGKIQGELKVTFYG